MPTTSTRCSIVGVAVLLATSASFANPPFTGYYPTSGPVCSNIYIPGAVPRDAFNLGVEINKESSAKVTTGMILSRESVGIHDRPPVVPGVIATVPGDATSGVVNAGYLLPAGAANLPILDFVNLAPPFTITGPSIPQPKITSLTANPTIIEADTGGTTLSWTVEGLVTTGEMNDAIVGIVPRNPVTHMPLGGFVLFSSTHVDPTQSMAYRLAVGNQCLSAATQVFVTVLPKLALKVIDPSAQPLVVQRGTVVNATISLDPAIPRLHNVTLTCTGMNADWCDTSTIDVVDNPHATSAVLDITPTSAGAANLTVLATEQGNPPATTQLSIYVPPGVIGLTVSPGSITITRGSASTDATATVSGGDGTPITVNCTTQSGVSCQALPTSSLTTIPLSVKADVLATDTTLSVSASSSDGGKSDLATLGVTVVPQTGAFVQVVPQIGMSGTTTQVQSASSGNGCVATIGQGSVPNAAAIVQLTCTSPAETLKASFTTNPSSSSIDQFGGVYVGAQDFVVITSDGGAPTVGVKYDVFSYLSISSSFSISVEKPGVGANPDFPASLWLSQDGSLAVSFSLGTVVNSSVPMLVAEAWDIAGKKALGKQYFNPVNGSAQDIENLQLMMVAGKLTITGVVNPSYANSTFPAMLKLPVQ